MKKLGLLGLMLSFLACSHAPSHDVPTNNWDKWTAQFLQDEFKANPDEAAHVGLHQYDGMLPDLSAEGQQREILRLTTAWQQMMAFPEAPLSEQQKFQRRYLLAAVDSKLFWLSKTDMLHVSPAAYMGTLDPAMYIIFNYAPAPDRLAGFIKFAHAVPRAVSQIRANMRPPIPLPLLDQGQLMLKGLASYMTDDIPKAFASVDDPALQKELKSASAEASQALLEFSLWLETQRSTAKPTFALGAEKMQEMLVSTEHVTTPLAAIKKAGLADLQSNLNRLKLACAQYAPNLSVKACVDKEESQKPKEDMLTVARNQLHELKGFLESHHIVTIPNKEEALVDYSPPYMRWNTAFISTPGVYDKGLPSTYYIAPPDPTWSQEKQTAYLRSEPHLLIISAHEVWPGHFLDGLHLRDLKPPAGLFSSYASSEGWAHYSEEMMLDAGLREGQPEAKIAQTLEALLRDVRLLSSIGIHTGKMTQKQSEKMFLEKAYADPATAKQQAARGVFDPGYLNYTLGKLMIRKLRTDWTANRGGKTAWKDFHDKFLSYGDAPVPLIRDAMMGTGAEGSLL